MGSVPATGGPPPRTILTEMTEKQAAYIGVAGDGAFKPDHYRN